MSLRSVLPSVRLVLGTFASVLLVSCLATSSSARPPTKTKRAVPALSENGSVRVVQQRALEGVDAAGRNDLRTMARKLEEALRLARTLAPLEVTHAVVVTSPPTGMGGYMPSPGGRLQGRQLRLYVEVKNYLEREVDAAPNEMKNYEGILDVTGVFFLSDGSELGKKSLGTKRFETRSPTGHTWLGLDVQLGESVPPGTYAVRIEVLDRVSEKKGSRRVAFEVR